MSCGKEVSNEDATFCPYCTKPLPLNEKQTSLPVAAGILAIIPSCLIGLSGIAIIGLSIIQTLIWWVGLVGIIFTTLSLLGVTSGLFMIKRRNFAFSVICTSLLLLAGIALFFFIPLFTTPSDTVSLTIDNLSAVLLVVCSTLSLILTANSRKGFRT